MPILTYPAGSAQTVATLDLGACYPAGASVAGVGGVGISQVAGGHIKTFECYILDAPYTGSVAGAIFHGFTQALSSDSTCGCELRGINNSTGSYIAVLSQTTDTLYLVVIPNYTVTDWYGDQSTGGAVFTGTPSGSSVACPVSPTCAFSADVTDGEAPLTVAFVDLSTGIPDPDSWLWDFGDGDTSTEQDPTHVFAAEGEYTVSLTVSNGVDPDCSTTITVTVEPHVLTVKPKRISIDKSLRLISDIAEVEITNEDLATGWGPSAPFATNTRIRIWQWYGDD